MTETWRMVARVGDVKPNDVIAVVVDGTEMVVGRDGDRYFATQRRCVHRGGDLAEGIVSRGHLICPQHAWRFSTETGCQAEASEFCLATYRVRVVGDRIEVDPSPQMGQPRSKS
ncbi:MAG: Rieske (2Fe-2S) protein [Deltaproteobacteria bacterium]|nr:MAG: Rieske (2Fe-2S) protein [Deltaproteobacteria bacterium]TMQ24040.1 MAG: Rieske (2Fe-2S) protein [Deltaproteobacteria bacterium]